MQIQGATALVTGGTRGLGAGFTSALLEGGARRVYVAARHTVPSTDDRVTSIELDVTDADQVAAAAKQLSDVTVVINNAGSYHGGVSVLEAPVEDFRADLEANVFGVLNVSRAFAPVLAANGGGAFVNVHSLLSFMTAGDGYSVSKAAAWGLTNAVRGLTAPDGTEVLGVHVGFMDTDMTRHITGVDKSNPDDIARAALRALEEGQTELFADQFSVMSKQAIGGDPAKLFFG